MATVSVHEAKTHLSRLINDVLAGKEVIVSRGKQEVVRIVPLEPIKKSNRVPGRLAHVRGAKGILEHGFWDPLPDDVLGIGVADDPLS